MEGINRPDKSYLDKLSKDTNDIINKLYEVKRDYEENLNKIDSLFEGINSKKADEVIDNTTIENFGLIYPDIKVTTLKNNGFDNVGKLRKALKSNVSIDGIGDIVKQRIMINIDSYKKAISGETLFNFDLENRDADEEKLLKGLYEYKNNIDIINIINKVLDDYSYNIRTSNKKVKTGFFWRVKWFFYSKVRKENIIEAIKYNENFLEAVNKSDIKSIVSDYYVNKIIEFDVWDEFRKNSASFYAILENIVGTSLSQDKISGDLEDSLIKKIEGIKLNTENLTASLRGWQKFGAKYTISQKRVLIGDEMGLGKTLEAIAVMGHLKSLDKKHFFVVCPASIITNWIREIQKHSNLVPYKVHGSARDEILNNWIKDGGVGITSYDTARLLNFPKDLNIDLLVSDEAHYIKNEEAQRSKVVYSLTDNSEYVMYMTGTPIENNLKEMLTIINKLQPDVVRNIQKKPYLLSEKLFKEAIAPVYIRRNRKDVLMELPALTQVEEWVEFGSSEEKVYEEFISEGNFMGMRRAAFTGESRKESPKLNRLLELVNESIENKNKVIIFSFFRGVISKVYNELKDVSVEPITGSVSSNKRQELIDEFSNSDEKMVLISQIQAGGVGLNIQSANTIVFCEPQIKPSLETQAISRAYRMGQVKNVFVYRLLTENSIDELMMKMLGNKQYVFDTYAKESYITDESLDAKDTGEQNIMKQIIHKEKERLSQAS